MDGETHFGRRDRLETVQLFVANGGSLRDGFPGLTLEDLDCIAANALAEGDVLAIWPPIAGG